MDETNPEEQAEQTERRRPRVVDKRVSTRMSEPGKAAPAGPEVSSGSSLPTSSVSSPPPSVSSASAGPPQKEGEGDVWTPEREVQARQVAQQIAETPSLEWVVNVAVTLANVAGTKLDLGAVDDARLAIDAFAGLLDKVGDQLGDATAPLRQTLAQLQMAYAQLAAPPPKT